MPANQDGGESLGRTVLRGAAWGVGFTLAVGAMHWAWHKVTEEKSGEDDEDDYWQDEERELVHGDD